MSIPIETVKTASFAMDFFHFGQGEKPFVILPGLSIQSVTLYADAVAQEYEELTKEFTVYVFDRRTELPARYSIEDMADDTAAAMEALGLRDVYLFGASQGGMIALVIAIKYPALVRKMVLGSTSAHVTDEQYRVLDQWVQLAEQKDRRGLYLNFGEKIYPPAVFQQFREALLSAAETVTDEDLRRFIILAEAIRGFDVTVELPGIRCPVLAIGVFEDAVLDDDATMEIAEKLDEQGSFRLYMYVGFGHAAFDTAPDYRRRILAFLRDDSPDRE